MNMKEWKTLSSSDKYKYYNEVRSIQKTLKYNQDPNAVVIHHLRDTEEQRKYNDEHYELWGFNEGGTFEYGKYVIFVTKEEHVEIHKCSEETRKKRSESLSGEGNYWYGKHRSNDEKRKISDGLLGIVRSDDTKNKIGRANKGKVLSDETKKKISNSVKATMTAEHRNEISESVKKSMTDEHRKRLSEIQKSRITPEIRQQMSERSKEVCNRPDVKKKNSDSHKLLWETEEYRKKQKESRKNIVVSDETKDKLRSVMTEKWRDLDYREKITTSLKNKPHSDEHNSKVKEARQKMSNEYKVYRYNGGNLSWNDFQKWFKENSNK